jgi:hypothetical protein
VVIVGKFLALSQGVRCVMPSARYSHPVVTAIDYTAI